MKVNIEKSTWTCFSRDID